MDNRELTSAERAKIRKLVIGGCANYDYVDGCIPLDCDCYMLNKWWTGSYCLYFQHAVLPLDPVLMAALLCRSAPVTEMRPCAICGTPIPKTGRNKYCSAKCRLQGERRSAAKRSKRYRQNKRSSVTD